MPGFQLVPMGDVPNRPLIPCIPKIRGRGPRREHRDPDKHPFGSPEPRDERLWTAYLDPRSPIIAKDVQYLFLKHGGEVLGVICFN